MKRAATIAALLILAAAGGWLAGRSRTSTTDDATLAPSVGPTGDAKATATAQPPRADRASAQPDPARSRKTATTPAAAPSAEMLPPLPAPDAPLAPHLDELRRRARDGDVRAACRLAMGLDACARMPLLESISDGMAAAAAVHKVGKEEIDATRRWDEQVVSLRTTCKDVVALDDSEAFRWQMQAALAGHREMLFRAGAMPALRSGEILEHVPEWQRWREHALDFLQQAVASGDPRAIMLLPDAFGRESDGRPRIAPVDPAREYLYARLRTRVAEASGNRDTLSMAVALEHGQALDATARASVEAEADRMFAAHYGGRSPAELAVGDWRYDDFAACER